MDPNRLKEAYHRLESLDERMTYKLRERSGFITPTPDQINAKLKDVTDYTLELKDILRDLILAFAKRPSGG